ncbi:MAG: hypothetical protein FH762_08925 [Firmicutes bacterium]|nr:hypothetical protein [Bacillota bacterium]
MFKRPLVGILGFSGVLGQMVYKTLVPKYAIRGGQRSTIGCLEDDPSVEIMEVDIHEKSVLNKFCLGCDVVVNCAGPSFKIKERVARAANQAGADYVDAFGANILEDILLEKSIGTQNINIISAGSFPGLSALLPRWLSLQYFNEITSLLGYCGGQEYTSKAATIDLLLSTVSGFGRANAEIKEGDIVSGSNLLKKAVILPCISQEVYAQKYLSCEMVKLAKLMGIPNLQWYTVMADQIIYDGFLKACALIANDPRDTVLSENAQVLSKLSAVASNDNSNWYSMVVELQGIIQGEEKRKRVVLKSADSGQLSGLIAAMSVEAILEKNLKRGVYWAFEVLDPEEVVEALKLSEGVKYLKVTDIPVRVDNGIQLQREEGVL